MYRVDFMENIFFHFLFERNLFNNLDCMTYCIIIYILHTQVNMSTWLFARCNYCFTRLQVSNPSSTGLMSKCEYILNQIFVCDTFMESKLVSLVHRRKVACLSIFNRIHFGEYAKELYNLHPSVPSFFGQ